ncbi:MAG: nuclear transport factor 2 family protein [Alphaproteobacteria bacterium]|nr:nuclear transport factor 2 family protein [Alphaproteobacteria bacterium]
MSERTAVLFVNEAFYRAFADRDAKAMDELWSPEAAVTCLHPGWGPLEGRQEVIESWRRILGNETSPAVICRRPRVYLHGPIAIVLCYEQIEDQLLVATNIFRQEGRHWRLIHHQAGPTAVQLPEEEAPAEAPKPN